jgi:hypothetical protein
LFGVRVHVGLEPADRDDLVLGPNPDGDGAGPVVQDNVGAAVRVLQRWEDAAVAHPDEGGVQDVCRELSGSWHPKLCLQGREKAGVSMILETFLII